MRKDDHLVSARENVVAFLPRLEIQRWSEHRRFHQTLTQRSIPRVGRADGEILEVFLRIEPTLAHDRARGKMGNPPGD
jgi:hypothetical protein